MLEKHKDVMTLPANIIFKNNQSLSMNESYYVLQKQYQRTAMCILQYSTPEQLQAHSFLGL